MKVAFDENTPAAMVRLFQGFQKEKALRKALGATASEIEVVRAQNYYPQDGDADFRLVNGKVPDDPWIVRFAKDGGKAIISGDRKMLLRPHEKLALLQTELVVVFMPALWAHWPLCSKVSLLIHWWEKIAVCAKTSSSGFYAVPKSWPLDMSGVGLMSLPTADLKLEKIEAQKAKQEEIRAKRVRDRRVPGARDMFVDEPEA